MTDLDERLDRIINAADQSGISVDVIAFLISGLDSKSEAVLLGNVEMLPKYMKSRDIPYRVQSRIAPSIETRKPPLSH